MQDKPEFKWTKLTREMISDGLGTDKGNVLQIECFHEKPTQHPRNPWNPSLSSERKSQRALRMPCESTRKWVSRTRIVGCAQSIRNESKLMIIKVFRSPTRGERLDAYTRIPSYHIVFDVKFDGRKKARLVAGGNQTYPPREDTYSGVVEQLRLRHGYMVASLNDLQVCAGDVGNAF